MKFTLFARLTANFLFIALLVLGVGLFMLYQLAQIDKITLSILNVDHRVLELEKRLVDSLLSQMRYEQKFMVTRDESFLAQFSMARHEFSVYMEEALLLVGGPSLRGGLENARANHRKYQALVEEEKGLVQSGKAHSPSWYKAEKEKTVDLVLESLKAAARQAQQATLDKVNQLKESEARARKGILAMGGIALLGILVISFFMTRSITRPISVLIGKTREISRGVFRGDLHLSSPPEVKELATAFNSMCDQLGAVDKMKSDFYSTMSHEMRTPLASIKEGTSLLLEGVGGGITEKQRKLLNIIAGESHRLIELVNSFLDYSRIEEGRMPFHFRPADILPLIRQVVEEIEPLALAKKIHVQVVSAAGLTPVNMDPERILQVLRNFLSNAVKFTPQGGRVKVTAEQPEGGLWVSVEDTGPGISRENLKSIFEKFRQGPGTGWGSIKGSGLGLALVKQIILEHGGKVWAESQPGRGSSFIFVLPA